MKLKAVVCAAVSVMLMAACERAPEPTSPSMDASQLHPSYGRTPSDKSKGVLDWSTSETNPCNADEIAIVGSAMYEIETSFDKLGFFHYASKVESKGTGLGSPGGKSYQMNQTDSYTVKVVKKTGGYVIHQEQKVNVKGPKDADSYTKTFMFKVTLDASGAVVGVAIETSSTKCS